MKFCLLFNLSPCARYCLLIGSQLTTWSQGNLHYIRLHFFQLDREFFCLLPSLARLYSAAASPSERLRSDGSLAINCKRCILLMNVDNTSQLCLAKCSSQTKIMLLVQSAVQFVNTLKTLICHYDLTSNWDHPFWIKIHPAEKQNHF